MPNFNQFFQHSAIPDHPSGYELFPCANVGAVSIVSPAGAVANLNALGCKVAAYTGLGMAPIENITTPYGILGGSLLQRTVTRSRLIALAIVVQAGNYPYVQKAIQSVINQVAPSNSQQIAADLKLRFQLISYNGQTAGLVLDTPVVYNGGLEGSVSGLYEERFTLFFLDLNPPDTVEAAAQQPSLSYSATAPGSFGQIAYRTATGAWTFIGTPQGARPSALAYSPSGDLYYGTEWEGVGPGGHIMNRSGTMNQLVTITAGGDGRVYALVFDSQGRLYAGGKFNNPQNWIMFYNGASWQPVGATLNGIVFHIAFDNAGNLYAAGQFTTPTGRAGMWNGASWAALGTGFNGDVYDIVKGLDGFMYFAGAFTTANGVTVNYVARWTGTTFVSLGGGMNNSVYGLAVMPDGRIIATGVFTTAGGVTVNGVAVWNGQQWQSLNGGVNSNLLKAAVNPLNNDIYGYGPATASIVGTYPLTNLTKFNGSLWLPQDALPTHDTNEDRAIAIRSTDGEIAVTTYTAVPYGPQNILPYTGTADCFPQIKFTGPGQLYCITNYATGKAIYFNYLLLVGETATLTNGPNGISFVSSFFGNVLGRILPGSDLTVFGLIPGNNYIVPFIRSGTGATKVELIYKNTHWSINAGA